jgi:hypothetical protein
MAIFGTNAWDAKASSWNQSSVNIDGQEYLLNYSISGATLRAIVADKETTTLNVIIDAQDDGILTIELPRNILDSLEGRVDKPFLVYIIEEGIDEGGNSVPTTEMYDSENSRILQVEFKNSASQIQISGTYIVPEFSPFLISVVLTGSMAGIAAIRQQRVRIKAQKPS